MIKKISEDLMKQLNPDLPDNHKKWINVFNEIQYRMDTLFEALISWYSGSVFLMHIDHFDLDKSRGFMPLRLKGHIYEGYLFIELWNLLDPRGESSITKFVNYWTKDIKKGGKEFTDIFQKGIDFVKLLNHFNVFNQWTKDNKIKIDYFQYMRNKNYGHIDNDFKYNNKVSYEFMIETIAFLSDFTSILASIMNMLNFRFVKGEPKGIQKYIIQTLSIDILRIRINSEIVGLSDYYKMNGKNKKIFVLNCFDSVEETLKEVELSKF